MGEGVECVPVTRPRRATVSPNGNREHPKGICEPRSKVVVRMGCGEPSGNEEKRIPLTTPIEDFEVDDA